MNQNTSRRRKIIFDAIDNDKTYHEINVVLKNKNEKILNSQDYLTWRQFFFPIAKNDALLYKDIVEDGKDLSWIARKMKELSGRVSIS